jgi:hypothetical protein
LMSLAAIQARARNVYLLSGVEECLGIVLEALAPSVQRLMNEKRVTSRDAMVHARPPGTTRCLPISIYEYTP